MKKLLLVLFLSVSGMSVLFGQSKPDTTGKNALKTKPEVEIRRAPARKPPKTSQERALKIKAEDHIRNLKNGVLLVRLRTSDIGIKNLKAKGDEKMAETVKRQQEAENQRIMYAFRKQFDFCPVYFFFSSETSKLKAGQTKGIFLNDNLQVDETIALPDTNFYVAELTDIEQLRLEPDSPQESVNAEVSFRALVIRDSNFHQLSKPFPFFIKAASNFPPRKRSEAEMANLMNAKLISFFKYVTQGKSK